MSDQECGRLAGKTAIITGAGGGIGRASAQLFASHGAKLVLADLNDSVVELAESLRSSGAHAVALRLDASDPQGIATIVETALQEFGGLDIAFANAGISGGTKSIFEQDGEDWETVLRVNLIGPALFVRDAARQMCGRAGGSIICTASIAGLRSGAGGPAYSASKAGVINLVKVAAQQFSGSNVRVNALCPGLIETGMTRMIFDGARSVGKEAKLGQLAPLRRPGTTDEIAKVALFLASAESSFVNGQAIVADGGMSSSHPFARQEFGKTAV